jgi:hypothetical protein
VHELVDACLEGRCEAPRDLLNDPVSRDADGIIVKHAPRKYQPAVVAEVRPRALALLLERLAELVERTRQPGISTHAQVADELRRVLGINGCRVRRRLGVHARADQQRLEGEQVPADGNRKWHRLIWLVCLPGLNKRLISIRQRRAGDWRGRCGPSRCAARDHARDEDADTRDFPTRPSHARSVRRSSVALLAKLLGPQIVTSPADARVAHAGSIHRRSRRQEGVENRTLGARVANRTERQAERVGDEDRPRRFDDRRDLDDLRDRDGAQPGFVEHALDQSHGLLADRSCGSKQDQVDAVEGEPGGDHWSGLFDQDLGIRDVAHERINGGTHLPDAPVVRGGAQVIQW